jgi:hypothetical protein
MPAMSQLRKQGSDWELPVLAKAKAIARKSVRTLQQLQERFPDDLPADVVERIQRATPDEEPTQDGTTSLC